MIHKQKTIKTPSAVLKLFQSLCAKRDDSVFKSQLLRHAIPLVTTTDVVHSRRRQNIGSSSLKNRYCCYPLATKEVRKRFFREAGFLLGCAVKPTGYSEMAVQGLSSLLEQNLKRWLRMTARRAGNTDKCFEGFCYKKK